MRFEVFALDDTQECDSVMLAAWSPASRFRPPMLRRGVVQKQYLICIQGKVLDPRCYAGV